MKKGTLHRSVRFLFRLTANDTRMIEAGVSGFKTRQRTPLRPVRQRIVVGHKVGGEFDGNDAVNPRVAEGATDVADVPGVQVPAVEVNDGQTAVVEMRLQLIG